MLMLQDDNRSRKGSNNGNGNKNGIGSCALLCNSGRWSGVCREMGLYQPPPASRALSRYY